MGIAEEIMAMIGASKTTPAPVTRASNLYTDLGYDSLAFVSLLLEIENAYTIRFELIEMEGCFRADRLIELVERKRREAAYDSRSAGRSNG